MIKEATDREQLKRIRLLYEEAFPKSEKKPFRYMLKKRKEGFFDLLAIEDEEGNFCGLAIMMLANGLALLDYLAVAPQHRGSGVGSAVLCDLRKKYGEDRIVIEIESTVGAAAESAENAGERLRRKEFYLRNGLKPVDFRVNLFGVEMEVLTYGRTLTFEAYASIYKKVLPGWLAGKVRLAGAD